MSIVRSILAQVDVKWLIFFNVVMGTLMATINGGIANVALPAIAKGFNIGIDSAQWIISVYFLVIASLLPIFGKLADWLGRIKIYIFGLLIFSLGAILCTLSSSIYFLIFSRGIQGIGASMIMSNNLAIVSTFFVAERGKMLGITNMVVGVGHVMGPTIGGLILDNFGWNAVFLAPLPFGILGILLGLTTTKMDVLENKSSRKFDCQGAFLLMVGVLAFITAFTNGDKLQWNIYVKFAILASIICLVLFWRNEKHHPNPIINVKLFRNYIFVKGLSINFLFAASLVILTIIMPFYCNDLLGYTGTKTGLMLMAVPMGMILTAPLSGFLFDKYNLVHLTTIGLSVSLIGLLKLTSCELGTSSSIIFSSLLVFGLGRGLFQAPNNSAVMNSVESHELSIAGSMLAFFRNLAQVLGTTFAAFIFTKVMSIKTLTQSMFSIEKIYLDSVMVVIWSASGILALAVIVSAFREKGSENK